MQQNATSYKPKGFNHNSFVVEYRGVCPPDRDLLVACAKQAHPNWDFSIAEAHMLHHYREWHRNGRSEYSLSARFKYKLNS